MSSNKSKDIDSALAPRCKCLVSNDDSEYDIPAYFICVSDVFVRRYYVVLVGDSEVRWFKNCTKFDWDEEYFMKQAFNAS